MDFSRGVFMNEIGPIPDRPNGPDIHWLTVWFDPEDSKLTFHALARLIIFRIHNRQATIDIEPQHQKYSHCLSLRIEGPLRDDAMIYDFADRMMDWYLDEFKAGRKFINRQLIFRRRS
jgi:hypothetical protein